MPDIDMTQPEAPELERAYRDAIEALRPLVRAEQPIEVPLEELGTSDLRGELEETYANAEMISARELGAHMSWEASAPADGKYGDLRTYFMDFDSGMHRDSDALFPNR